MTLQNKKIGFAFFIAGLFIIAICVYVLFSIRLSYREQVAQINKQSSENVLSKLQSYQENIENTILANFAIDDNAEVNTLSSFIHVLSYSDSTGNVIYSDFPQGDYYLVKDNISNKVPFSALINMPDGLWVKSSTNSGGGVVEYAYKLDRLENYLNVGHVKFLVSLKDDLGNDKYYGLSDSSLFKGLKQESELIEITYQDITYSVYSCANLLTTSNYSIGKFFLVSDITAVKSVFGRIFFLSVLLEFFAIVLIFSLMVFWWKYYTERIKTSLTIEKLKGDGIGKHLGNHEIKQIYNATANGIRIINTNFDIVAVNSSFCKISGQNNDQVEGQKCYTVFHGIYCHTANCPLERIKNGEHKIESNEFRFKKDGKKVRCVYGATPLFNSDNQLIGIVEDFKDISERHAVEETLKQTEKRFEVFMDSLPLGVFIEDGITHEILYQNTYLGTITGGGSIKSFLPEETQEKLSKSYLESEEENQIVDVRGDWRYFLTHKFKFLGVNNQLKIGGVMIDITKKKEAEQYRDVLSKALENSPVSVAILSPDLEIEFINPSFASLTGYGIDEIYSRDILDLNLEYSSSSNLSLAIDCIKHGQIWQGEVHLANKDGDHFWVSALFTPIVNQEGHVQHAVAIMENITKRKEYEKELLFAKSKAEESDRLKSAFLSNLSHEIRTPLNAIIGFSSLLSDNDLSYGERRNISEIIYRNSNDLLRLIENLIEISEIETGQLLIKKKEFSVNSMMSSLYTQLIDEDKKAANVKLSLKKEIHGDDLVILSDQTRVQQVLFQLLSNSCKFTENGFIEFGYSLKDESTLMFYVVDSGIGIEPEKLSLLFNPFRQVDDSNTRRYSGMGLGLAISKHIVEKLGGKIWLNSVPNSGTSVYFTIPFIPINSKFETDNQFISKESFKWNNKTILVADDIDANYVYLKAALKKTEANVLWARNGVEAVDFVKNGSGINLILMDLVMPEMDGFEATKMIKDLNNQIPIIGQTAYPSQKNFSVAKESGFDSMLEKPIKVNRMLMELDKYLNN
ncbi:MAG: PAS domain S-box protein [Bacteroidales bacterium]